MNLKDIKAATRSRLRAARKLLSLERVARAQSIAVIGGYILLLVSDPAAAQSLRQTGESIFNTLYQCVGVIGGISFLACMLNWKTGNWLNSHDPKKLALQSLVATGCGFAVVAIIQFVKTSTYGSGNISGV